MGNGNCTIIPLIVLSLFKLNNSSIISFSVTFLSYSLRLKSTPIFKHVFFFNSTYLRLSGLSPINMIAKLGEISFLFRLSHLCFRFMFIFLDSSFPFIYKLSKNITKNFAIRVSDFESINTALSMTNRVKWIWLDCFKKYSISIKLINKLKTNNFKICLVFPDLHGRDIQASDKLFYKSLKRNNIRPDMICIKKRNIDFLKFYF